MHTVNLQRLDETLCYTTGCTNGDVRLIGGGFGNEGTVEVCFNNLWGLIADSGWNDADARVVCRKLGHLDGSMHDHRNSMKYCSIFLLFE